MPFVKNLVLNRPITVLLVILTFHTVRVTFPVMLYYVEKGYFLRADALLLPSLHLNK
jgi:hypothetical protein